MTRRIAVSTEPGNDRAAGFGQAVVDSADLAGAPQDREGIVRVP